LLPGLGAIIVTLFRGNYVIGPPIVQAATSLVTIQGAGSANKAKVARSGRLLVDSAGTTSIKGAGVN